MGIKKMTKVIIEDMATDLSIEDSGHARILRLDGEEDSNIFVRLQSWDEECTHEELMQFYNKKVRITIETVDE